MRSVYIILDRTAAVIQSLKNRLNYAQIQEKKACDELANLQRKLQSLGSSLGMDAALSAVSTAADRTETIAGAIKDLKARLHAQEIKLSDVIRAMDLPADVDAQQLVLAAKESARHAHALEILHPVLRGQTKSVTAFSDYIITNAENDTKIRRYVGLTSNKTVG